jgi:hypothetical protein
MVVGGRSGRIKDNDNKHHRLADGSAVVIYIVCGRIRAAGAVYIQINTGLN